MFVKDSSRYLIKLARSNAKGNYLLIILWIPFLNQKTRKLNYSFQKETITNKIIIKANELAQQYILGYPEDVGDQTTQKFAPNNPFFDFVIVQKNTLGNLQRFKIHTFDYTVGTIQNKLKDFIKGPKAKILGDAQQLYALVSQIKNMQQLKGIQPENIQFKHIFLAPDYQIKSFQQEVKKQIRSKAFGNKKRSLILFEGMYMNPKNNIGMIVGVKAAKYFVRGDHFQLSQKDRNQEELFFVSFKSVIETISAKNSLKK